MVATPPAPVDTLADDLERLDTAAVAAGVERLAEGGTPIDDILDRVVLPAWERVDRRGRAGDVDPSTPGAAAGVARRAIAGASRAGRRHEPGSRGVISVVSPAGPADLLRSEAVAEAAAGAGWVVQQVDGGDAAGELSAYVRSRRPAAVVVTAQDPVDLLSLVAVTTAAHEAALPVLAWGPAFGDDAERSRRLGADGWAPDLAGVLETLGTWAGEAPRLESAAALQGVLAELERLRPSLLQAASGCGAAAGAAEWARRAAPAVVDRLLAAVAFEEPSILVDHLGRERRGRLDDVHVVGLVDAVASALPPAAVSARDIVLTARDELRHALMGGPRPLHPTGADRASDGSEPGGTQAGQVFADLLLLAALSCQTQQALLSVPQGPGLWRTLSYGFEARVGLDDRRLFDLIAARRDAVEVPDLAVHPDLVRSPLTAPPHNLRWAYGVALRQGDGPVLGVVVVLDRWLRQASRREQRALMAVARQAAGHLGMLRRSPVLPTPMPAPMLFGAPARPDPLSGLVSLRRAGAIPDGQQLLRSHEVAVLFDVTERTVINWAASGKLPSLRTIGGHLRFRREDVLELLDGRTSGMRARRSS